MVIFGLLVAVTAACGTTPPPPAATSTPAVDSQQLPSEIRVHQYENQAALDFKYSTAWSVIIPQLNFIVTGPTETVVGDEPGPLMAILRIPVREVHGNLEGEFNHYLDFGPKRDGYEIVEDISELEIDGRPAKQIRMRVADNPEENEIAQEAWIVGAEATNGVVYIFSATAPPDEWFDNQLLFKLLVQSVEFNE